MAAFEYQQYYIIKRAFITMLTLIFFVSVFSTTLCSVDYDALTCDGIKHTMCSYPAGGSSACTDCEGGMSKEEQNMIIDLHNELRQTVATGAETRGKKGAQPSASNMLQMSWNEEAAIVAQRWADQCDVEGHDKCRIIPGEKHVGQNIGQVKGSDSSGNLMGRDEAIRNSVTAWCDEVSYYDGNVSCFQADPDDLLDFGHYTQMMWGKSCQVGCGMIQCLTGLEYFYKLVCNYVPGGNCIDGEMYKAGDPCSECPEDTTCSDQWFGLCVQVDMDECDTETLKSEDCNEHNAESEEVEDKTGSDTTDSCDQDCDDNLCYTNFSTKNNFQLLLLIVASLVSVSNYYLI